MSFTGLHCPPCEQISHLLSQFIGRDSSWLGSCFLPSCVPVKRISCRKNDALAEGGVLEPSRVEVPRRCIPAFAPGWGRPPSCCAPARARGGSSRRACLEVIKT